MTALLACRTELSRTVAMPFPALFKGVINRCHDERSVCRGAPSCPLLSSLTNPCRKCPHELDKLSTLARAPFCSHPISSQYKVPPDNSQPMREVECVSRKIENNREMSGAWREVWGICPRVNGARLAWSARAKLSDNRQI